MEGLDRFEDPLARFKGLLKGSAEALSRLCFLVTLLTVKLAGELEKIAFESDMEFDPLSIF